MRAGAEFQGGWLVCFALLLVGNGGTLGGDPRRLKRLQIVRSRLGGVKDCQRPYARRFQHLRCEGRIRLGLLDPARQLATAVERRDQLKAAIKQMGHAHMLKD